MDYYEFMYRTEHDDSIFNLPEDRIEHDESMLNLPESGIGDVLDPWDEESCDDFFLGPDPYIPLY